MDAPVYEYVPKYSATLIGVSHSILLKDIKDKAKKFKDTLRTKEHLILEGWRFLFEIETKNKKDSLEEVAYSIFSGKANFLEENSSRTRSLQNFGISELQSGLYNTIRNLRSYLYANGRDSGCFQFLKWHQEIELKCDSYYKESTDFSGLAETTFDKFRPLLVRFAEDRITSDGFIETANIFESFLERVRDYCIICPKSKEFAEQLEGSKVFVLGKNHIIPIKNYLEKGNLEKPLDWNKYVEGKSEKVKEIVGIIQEIKE